MTFNRETTHLEYNVVCIFIFIFYGKNGSLALTISLINVCDASFFVFHAIEREISLSNNSTLS